MEIKEYIAPALKWWWLILLTTAVAGAASFFATRQQPLLYRSTATLVVGSAIDDPNPTSGDLYLTQQLAGFYVDMSYRSSVRDDTMDALDLDWLPEYYVRNVDNIIDIIVTDTNPERAQAVAAELTRQLILRSPTAQQRDLERQEFINRQLDSYELAITEAQVEIELKQEELTTLTSASDIAALQDEISSLESSVSQLENSYANLLSSTQRGATNSIRVIEPATLPKWPVDNSSTTTILTAAVIGLVLSASAAYLLEFLDNSISTPERLAKVTGLTTLAGIVEMKAKDSKLVTLTSPLSPIAEAYRVLRTAVQFAGAHDDQEINRLIVISAMPGEGKSTTSSNLGVVLAQAGYKVMIVDGDLRRPTQHRIFDLSNKRGLTSLLLQIDTNDDDERIAELLEETLQPTAADRLHLLACGPIPPNPSELLGSAKMRRLMTLIEEEYDYVITDSPPLLSVADGMILSKQADGVIFVAKATSKKDQVKQATIRLDEINANVIGTVINGVKAQGTVYNSMQYYREPYSSYGPEGAEIEEDGDGQDLLTRVRKRVLPGQTV